MAVSQRPDWYGEQQRLSPAWTLHKGRKAAKCVVWSHQFGWELRLIVGTELIQSQVCRSQPELIEVQEQWRAAMLAKLAGAACGLTTSPPLARICSVRGATVAQTDEANSALG
jgi:hypothetical protein